MRNVILAVATLAVLLGTIPARAQLAPLDPSRDPRYNPSINPNYNPSINPRYNPSAPVQPLFTPEGKPTDIYGVPDRQGGTNYFDSGGRWRGFSPRP